MDRAPVVVDRLEVLIDGEGFSSKNLFPWSAAVSELTPSLGQILWD